MNTRTDLIEQAMTGLNVELSTTELSNMVIELVKEINNLKNRINSLEAEVMDISQNHHVNEEILENGGIYDLCGDY